MATGRERMAGREWAAAASAIRQGLQLWRGPALADVADVADEPFAQGEATPIDELRLAGVEDLFSAELAMGYQASFVGELRPI